MNIIENSCLKIEDNKLSYENFFIQLSNISQSSVEKEIKNSYRISAVLGAIVGFIFCMDVDFPWIGIFIFSVSILFLLPTFIQNRKKHYILIIDTNSSSKFAFRCKEKAFLIKVLELIKNSISNNSSYIINLEQCTITNSQIGENNVMHSN